MKMQTIAAIRCGVKSMNVNLGVAMAILCFAAGNASANVAQLNPSEDAYIDWRSSDANFGLLENLLTSQSGSSGGLKTYTKWDASGYDAADILGIESLEFYRVPGGAGVSRAIDVWLLTRQSGLDDNWFESTITWDNAPWNAVAPERNNFVADGSTDELAPVRIGTFNVTGEVGWRTVQWGFGDEISAEDAKALVLAELTSEDQQVTIGLTFRGSGDRTYLFASKDNADPSLAPILTLNIIPEPSVLALAGMGIAGLFIFRRRARG